MKNKIFIYLIVAIVIISGGLLIINNSRLEVNNKIEISNTVGKANTVLNYKGNYYDLMLSKGKAMMNNKLYDVYNGWISPYYDQANFYDTGVDISAYNNGDNFIGSDKADTYDGVTAKLDKVFIMDNGVERLINFEDQLVIKESGFFTFKAFCEVEAKPLGFFGRVAKACPDLGPSYLQCEKIVFQKPNEGESLNFKAKSFYDDFDSDEFKMGIIPEQNQGMQSIEFTIKGDINKLVTYIPASVSKYQNDNRDWIFAKIDGLDPIATKYKDWIYDLDKTMVANYDVSGKYLCSPFNEFCFLKLEKLIVNLNLKLDEDKNIVFDNFYYFNSKLFNEPMLKYVEGDWVLSIANNGEWLKTLNIDVVGYIDRNKHLESMAEESGIDNYHSVYGKMFKDDYTVETSGQFNCGNLYDIIKSGIIECMVKPDKFYMEITPKFGVTNETLPGFSATSSEQSSKDNQ